jgi:hypothetical protein
MAEIDHKATFLISELNTPQFTCQTQRLRALQKQVRGFEMPTLGDHRALRLKYET